MREGNLDPMWEALGRGYVGGWAYYAFADQGERVERAAFGVGGYLLEECGVYDVVGSGDDLAGWVATHDPDRIAVNMAENIGGADGLSHTSFLHLQEVLGDRYGSRLVSGERFVSDFRSTRTTQVGTINTSASSSTAVCRSLVGLQIVSINLISECG